MSEGHDVDLSAIVQFGGGALCGIDGCETENLSDPAENDRVRQVMTLKEESTIRPEGQDPIPG